MIHKLDDHCRRARFSCGDNEIDKWFRTKSLKLHVAGQVVVYKSRLIDGDEALGFCSYNIERYDARLLPRLIASVFDVRSNPHVFRFWFMGVRSELQCEGLGTDLVFRCLEDYYEAQKHIDIPAATTVALNSRVATFYMRFGFEPITRSEGHSLMLLPRRTLVDLIESA